MKRVSSFAVTICQPDESQHSGSADRRMKFDSWHKTCATILRELVAVDEESSQSHLTGKEAIAFDSKTNLVLARFSQINLEAASNFDTQGELANEPENGNSEEAPGTEESLGEAKIWDSVCFHKLDCGQLFENRNVKDFYWELLEGARREVPFRLSYLEKRAESSSTVAQTLSLIHRFRALFQRPL